MFYINQNKTLTQLENLVHENMQYMPKSFMKEQEKALELFQKRVFLEEIIEETIKFNRSLNWDNKGDKGLKITTTAEELISVFKLRSDIYTKINYQDEFPDTIEGLNFDSYDKYSAVIYYESHSKMIGTTRVIFDLQSKLPSEDKYSFDNLRTKYKNIAEVSRLVVKHEKKGLNLAFKHLMKGLYLVFNQNKLDMTFSGMKKEHYKFYSKLGGTSIIKELSAYGEVHVPCIIMSWDLSKTSKFFARSFLK